MSKSNYKREKFNPEKVPVVGSLAILALGDIGFAAWRKVKINNKNFNLNEEK
tara:strand:- start:1781 stop:1936 length:156 start_codon:yes stop_codon:yes gene_type:complete